MIRQIECFKPELQRLTLANSCVFSERKVPHPCTRVDQDTPSHVAELVSQGWVRGVEGCDIPKLARRLMLWNGADPSSIG